MIIGRYLQRSIFLGTLAALFVLVSLSLFFLFVRELDEIGQGNYGLLQVLRYIVLGIPARIVEFMPLAALLGSMLSLGALAGNSEIIAMQASGVSLPRMLAAVVQAGLLLALLSFLLADLVVPDSQTNARNARNQAREATAALQSRQGLWVKDETSVVHIAELLPNGFARDVEIFELGEDGGLDSVLRAERALPVDGGWELRQVVRSTLGAGGGRSESIERMAYRGNLSPELLRVLMIEPRRMSSLDLFSYLQFLDENRLDARVERLVFWQKIFAPLTIVVMCLLAFPFVLGSQRQTNTGQRLLFGILLGLAFVALDRLLTQLGTQFDVNAVIIALLPNLIFFALALWLLMKRLSFGVVRPVVARKRQP